MDDEHGGLQLRITVDDPAALSPAVREAVERLAGALAEAEAADDEVAGYSTTPRIEIGKLDPRTKGPFVSAQPDSWMICLGYGDKGDSPFGCTIFYISD